MLLRWIKNRGVRWWRGCRPAILDPRAAGRHDQPRCVTTLGRAEQAISDEGSLLEEQPDSADPGHGGHDCKNTNQTSSPVLPHTMTGVASSLAAATGADPRGPKAQQGLLTDNEGDHRWVRRGSTDGGRLLVTEKNWGFGGD